MNYKVAYSKREVQKAVAGIASEINILVDENTVFFVMLNGGYWLYNQIEYYFDDMGLETHFIKGHSYERNKPGSFEWQIKPTPTAEYMKGKNIIVIDDMCDSGQSTNEIHRELRRLYGDDIDIHFYVLICRSTTKVDEDINLSFGIYDNSPRFFVGCGMDDNGRSRNLPYIGVVEP